MQSESVQLTASVDNLPQLLTFIEGHAAGVGMASARIPRVLIALEEAFVNICRYAYGQEQGDVWIRCGMEQGRFMVEITDTGQPFNLEGLPDPEMDVDLAHRKVGGLGVFCMRNLADEVHSLREGERNILRLLFQCTKGQERSPQA